MDAGMVLDLVTAGLVAVGLVLWRSVGAGAEQAARDQAAEAVSRLNWPATLQRDLEQLRGTERQESRFESYGKLWAAMRPLAIYDDTPITRTTVGELSQSLSDWYFSEKGGLMLTAHNRDLYFALQDLLQTTAGAQHHWAAERVPDPGARFDELLSRRALDGALSLRRLLGEVTPRDWPGEDLPTVVKAWSNDVGTLATEWDTIDDREKFAVIQQVSSVLRTGLAYDVESRLR